VFLNYCPKRPRQIQYASLYQYLLVTIYQTFPKSITKFDDSILFIFDFPSNMFNLTSSVPIISDNRRSTVFVRCDAHLRADGKCVHRLLKCGEEKLQYIELKRWDARRTANYSDG